ncbi:MAG: fibronectin type III domain-containing protein [Bacteroidales bacterium]|nr:fibronectin type III domain-containing protein [Bacteroidales bacterium]
MKKIFIFNILCLFMAFGIIPQAHAQYDPCAIGTFPYTEDFETTPTGIPNCYNRNPLGVYQVNNILYPEMGTYLPHSGTNALRVFNNNYTDTAAQVPTLMLPPIEETYAMSDMVLEFWAQTVWNASPYFVVGVMDSPTDMSTFTAVQTIQSSASDTYVKYTVYFSDYSGTGRYIAIKFANTPGVFGSIVFDDITLDIASTCSPVLNLTVDNIFDADVTIKWQPNALGGANMYNVRLVNLNDESENYVSTYDTFYTFSGLSYSTDYRAFVTAVCVDGQESSADSVDFSTPIQSVSIPYFEDFEGEGTTALEPFIFQGTGINQWVYGTAAGMTDPDAEPGAGMHSLYVSPDSGATNVYTNSVSDAYAIFNVAFPDAEVEYHLAFDYRVEGEASDWMEYDYFKVYMLDAGATVPESGEPSGTALLHNLGEVANVPDWTHFDVILNNVAGSSKQIVLYWYNNGWNLYGDSHLAAAVDNISIYANDCGQPDNLSASNIATDGATLSWNDFGSASSWIVYYRAVGDAGEYNEVTVNGTPTVTINGLSSNTEYEFYVVANCGATQSNPSTIATFHTGCGPITELPFTENFETGLYSTSQGTFISCWSRLTSNNDHYAYIGDASWNAHGGAHFLDFHYTPNCFDIAIMPELGEEIDASDLLVSFYACHTNYGYNTLGTLEIGVMTNPDDTSSFVVIDTINISELDVYTYAQQIISLINYSGNGKYIAFRVSNSDGCGYYIDDITLELRPACMKPLNLSAANMTNESATLTWDELGNATAWNIQYDTVGFTAGQGSHTVSANATTFTVTGLDNLTSYDFYVQSNCGDTQSEWTGPLFITTGVINMGITGSDTLTTCEAIISDNGGVNGDYSTYCDYFVVVNPATEGSGLQITGTCDLSEGSYGYGESHLYFYEGEGTDGALIANYTGVNNNIAVASSGPITVRFTSSYNAGAGFLLNVACASCTPPSNITTEELNPTSATISWEGNADQYAVYLSGDATGYFTTSYNFLNLNNLSSNSTYNIQVRSLCGSDSSLLSPTFTFTTPCNAITITATNPWTEDFESYEGSGNQPFQCWSRPVVDDIYDAPFVYCGWEPSCHSGANSAEMKGSSEMLVLPLFSNDIHELRLSFWATSTDPSSGMLEIGVIPNITDPSSFELVGTAGTPGPRGTDSTGNGNYMGPFDFSGVTATNGRIALRYTNNFSSYSSWNLDDFVVELAPNCAAPSDVTVSNITTSSATVSWTADLGASAWKLQYKASNVTMWSTEEDCIAPTFNLINLVPATNYDVRVKTICDDENESAWSTPVTFTTESSIVIIEPTVETSAATDITTTTATLNATITDMGNQTIIVRGFEWKLSTAAAYENLAGTAAGNTFSATLADLTANTGYTFRAYVTTTNGTQYGEPMTFTTLPEDTPEPCDVPTNLHTTDIQNETISIAWDANANVNSWNVQYRPAAGGQWTQVTANTNSYTIANLTGKTNYEIQVQANCGDGNLSDWSASITAQTTDVGIVNYLENSITLFPNPANDVVNVQCTMNNVQLESVEVIDVYGKVVRTVVGANNYSPMHIRINVRGLANGMYFVRVTTDEGVATKTFIKK